MSSYYLTHENTNIHDNTNLHTLILMNNSNLATQFDHQQQQLSNNLGPFSHQFVRTDDNNITLYGYPQEEAREVSRARQGLSLSLSSQNHGVAVRDRGHVSVLGSKYLRAAQELLEQVVNVGHTSTSTTTATTDDHSPGKGKGVDDTPSQESERHGSGGTQISTSERQEIQMKKAKLVTMLDEAEQRYRHYNNQMQMVIESFEKAAGIGSAKTYTGLALKTISKQFRCLKDAIQSQIRAASKSLGEDHEGSSGSFVARIQGSRLKYIDHQIRQQRALQQLGMIPNHNAWRPQRGLPERSVSVLRAWLFEHFLHPYPKDSDKILLAKQTGLTRSQVSNWFINARVRLWKPMIEDMYNEELKDHEQTVLEDKSNTNEDTNGASNSMIEQEKININDTQVKVKPIKLDQQHHNMDSNSTSTFMSIPQHGFTLNGSLEMGVISQGSPKRQRSNEILNNNNQDFIGGELGSYPNNMGDLGRFETEEFSTPRFLSLGLPPTETHRRQFNHLSAATFMSPNQNMDQFRRGVDFGSMNSPSSQSSSAAFECIDIHNGKGFAAHLQPDFVA